MKKFLILSRCGPEYDRIVEEEDICAAADHNYKSCYGIIELPEEKETK